MPTIEIDGKPVEVEPGQMLIEAAEKVEAAVPRFCYHKKLSIAANCRMCLVEVENAPKALPACATPVSDGMVVKTNSPKAIAAQKAVMEFLLINHPLDCPICDQGGECELQDVAMGYGGDLSTFSEGKRAVKDQDIGPLIQTEMTRCIHCTRCVRFGEEVAGIRELGATGRGEHMQIGTFLDKSVNSNLSGNVIDLCPVGALTSKPFRYQARAWEMTEHDTIATHDCLGSNLHTHVRRQKVQRVAPRENETLNEVWLSDRDRFSYEGYNAADRAVSPQIKVDGQWQSVCWEKALTFAVNKTQEIIAQHGPDQMGFLANPSVSVEEGYLFQALSRYLGCHNIDHRLRMADFDNQSAMPAMPTLGITLADFEQLDGLVIVGGNLNEEVPLLAQRIRKAVKAGAKVFLVDVDPQEQIFDIAGVVRVEGADYAKTIQGWLNHPTNSSSEPLMTMLQSAPRKHILVAGALQQHPHYAAIYQTLVQLSEKLEATFGEVTPGANSAGLSLAGCLPHRAPGGKAVEREGLNAKELFEKPRKAYWFMGFEPEIDTLNPFASLMAVQSAELVVCVTPFVTPTMHQYADVILPMALPYETAGAYVTGTGQWQTVAPSINPPGEAKPAWKILRVLGNLFESPDFEYDNTQAVRAACRAQIEAVQCEPQSMTLSSEATSLSSSQVIAIPYLPHYGVDGILRRATALQQTTLAQVAKTVRLSEDVANRYGLTDGQMAKVIAQRQTEGLCLSVLIDDKLPANTAVVPWGLQESVVLGAPYQPVEIQPA